MAGVNNLRNKFRNIFLSLTVGLFFSFIFVNFGLIYAFAFISLVLVILISSKNIKALFYILFTWLMLYGILTNLTFLGHVSAISYIDDVLVLILFLFLFFRFTSVYKTKSSEIKLRLNKFVLAVLLFVFIVAASSFINKVSLEVFLNFSFSYTKVFIIFICAVVFLDAKEAKKFISFMLIFMLIQFFLSNLQFFSYGRGSFFVGPELSAASGWVDSARGTFGRYGAHKLGHFSMIFFILCSSLWIFTKRKKWLWLSLICFWAFAISFTEQDYVFIFVYFIFAVSKYIQLNTKNRLRYLRFILMSIILFAAIFLPLFAYKTNSRVTSRYFEYFSNPNKLRYTGKVQSLILLKNTIFSNSIFTFVGIGPGNFSGGIASKHESAFYKKNIKGREEKGLSTMDYWWSSFISLVGEVGIMGYMLYLSFYLILFRSLKEMDVFFEERGFFFERGIIFASQATIFLFMFISLLSNQLELLPLTYPLAIFIAYVWLVKSEQREVVCP